MLMSSSGVDVSGLYVDIFIMDSITCGYNSVLIQKFWLKIVIKSPVLSFIVGGMSFPFELLKDELYFSFKVHH